MSAALPPYLRLVDTKTGGPRYDVSPLFAEPAAFAALLADLAAPFMAEPPQLVAGIDALGFVLGTGLALRLGCGFVPVPKGGNGNRFYCTNRLLRRQAKTSRDRKQVILRLFWDEALH